MDAILRREQAIIIGCLTTIVLLAWFYLLHINSAMPNMTSDMPGMTIPHQWNLLDLILLFIMWSVMMIAMMLPSTAPMTLAFHSVNRRRRNSTGPIVSTYIFSLGYIVTWIIYSAVATLAQWSLHEALLISSAMVVTSPYLSGGLLVIAGVYQWTPLKRVCLAGCRSPLSFLMSEWREGTRGAFVMGLRHGSYCIGCCWVLMALLFVTGVMNLLWIAVIAIFVIVEKLLPRGELIGKFAGFALVSIGLAIIGRWI